MRYNNVVFLYNNVSALKCVNIQSILCNCNFPELDHPLYRPDLYLSLFFIILKKHLKDYHFANDNQLKQNICNAYCIHFSNNTSCLNRKCIYINNYLVTLRTKISICLTLCIIVFKKINITIKDYP